MNRARQMVPSVLLAATIAAVAGGPYKAVCGDGEAGPGTARALAGVCDDGATPLKTAGGGRCIGAAPARADDRIDRTTYTAAGPPAGRRNGRSDPKKRIADLIRAIGIVETGGGRQKHVRGDGGRSAGTYQIGRAYWADARAEGGLKGPEWAYEAAVMDDRRAEALMGLYWRRWCPKALAAGDLEVLARIHNGGPRGHRKPATLAYWRKVKAIVEKMENGK